MDLKNEKKKQMVKYESNKVSFRARSEKQNKVGVSEQDQREEMKICRTKDKEKKGAEGQEQESVI